MKVAIWYNLPSGGSKRALYDHIRGLLSRGHVVETWCPPTADQSYLPFPDSISQHVVDLKWPPPRTLDDVIRGRPRMSRLVNAMVRHSEDCAEMINRSDCDVFFSSTCQYFAAPFIGRFVKKPSVLYLGEPYRSLYEATPNLIWAAPPKVKSPWTPTAVRRVVTDQRQIWNSRVQVREETSNAASFDKILVNSIFTREFLLRCYGMDSEVCYPGIDTDRFRVSGRPRQRIVVGVGAFQPRKNIRLAMEAIGMMPVPRPKLVWVGNVTSGYLTEMTELAAKIGVEFEPHLNVGDDVLVDILNSSTVMIYASHLEPLGLAPLEAIACGVAVVGVAEGGIRETIFDMVNGLIVEKNAPAVGAAVERLFADPALAQRLVQQGQQRIEQSWSLDKATDRLEGKLALSKRHRDAIAL